MNTIQHQEVWDSIQQDHSPDALRVWSDFFKERGLDCIATMLIWYAGKTDRYPQCWGKVYKWSWYDGESMNGIGGKCELKSHDFELLAGGTYDGKFLVYDYLTLQEALEDFYRAAHTCKTCKGAKVYREITFTPQPPKKCSACKGTGKRRGT